MAKESWEIRVELAQRVVAPVPLPDVLASLVESGIIERWLICDGLVVVESTRKLEILVESLNHEANSALDGLESAL